MPDDSYVTQIMEIISLDVSRNDFVVREVKDEFLDARESNNEYFCDIKEELKDLYNEYDEFLDVRESNNEYCCDVKEEIISLDVSRNDFVVREVKDEYLDARESNNEYCCDIKEEPKDLYNEHGTSPANVRLCLSTTLLHLI